MKIAAFLLTFLGCLAVWPGVTATINRPEISAAHNCVTRVAPHNVIPTASIPKESSWLAEEQVEYPVFAELMEEDDDETMPGSRFRLIAAYFFVLLFLFVVNRSARHCLPTTFSRFSATCLYLWQRTLRI